MSELPENYYNYNWLDAIKFVHLVRSWKYNTAYKYYGCGVGNVNSSKGIAIKLFKMLFIIKNKRDKRTWFELKTYNPDLTEVSLNDLARETPQLIEYINNNGYNIKSKNDLFKISSALLDPFCKKENESCKLLYNEIKSQNKQQQTKAKNSIRNNPNAITYDELNKVRDHYRNLLKGFNITKIVRKRNVIAETPVLELYQKYLLLCFYTEVNSIKPPRITELSITKLITSKKYNKLTDDELKNNCYLVINSNKFIHPEIKDEKTQYSILLHFGKLARKGMESVNIKKENTLQYIKSKSFHDVIITWYKLLNSYYRFHFNKKPDVLFFNCNIVDSKPVLKDFTSDKIREIINETTLTVLYKRVNPKDIRNMREESIKILLTKVKQELEDMGHSFEVALNNYADELNQTELNELYTVNI